MPAPRPRAANRRHARKLGRTLAAIALGALAVVDVGLAGVVRAEPVQLTILHVNDLDRMDGKGDSGGLARLASVVKAERAVRDHVLLTNAGDAISPSLMSSFDQGAHIIDLYNAVGVDVMAAGNHEFDFGPAVATQRFSEAAFPVITANAIDADGEVIDGAAPTWTTEVGDFKLGFVGLTTADTAYKSKPGSVKFTPVQLAASEAAQQLRADGADLVIALAHTDLGEDATLLRQKAVDIVLSGDDHLVRTWYDGQTALVESGEQAEFVTALDLKIERVESRGRERVVWTPAFRVIATAGITPDPDMASKVGVYLDRLSAALDVEIGTTQTQLDSRRSSVRSRETAIGNLIADAMREAVGADIAITNAGGIRADRIYEPGTVLTRRDIQTELPFGNKTVSLELSGADVLAALENGFSRIEDGSGRFPQVSGLKVVIDRGRPAGSRVVSASVDGVALDRDATYTVATNDFVANGGDGYDVFKSARRVIDATAGHYMAAQVIAHIERAGSIAPAVEQRIRQ